MTGDGTLRATLAQYQSATPAQQQAWTGAYADALDKAGDDPAKVAAGDYGAVPELAGRLLDLAAAADWTAG